MWHYSVNVFLDFKVDLLPPGFKFLFSLPTAALSVFAPLNTPGGLPFKAVTLLQNLRNSTYKLAK
jgi:hypothetical protein